MSLYIIDKERHGFIMDNSFIRNNIAEVEKIIESECEKAGRDRNDVTLIAVSKTKPVEMLKEAYDYGCRDFGENKVQELVDKYEVLPKDIRWHMIGHLQTNKVKYIVDKVFLIHSVDSLKLAREISKEAAKKKVDVDILIEVNVAGEETKFGTTCDTVKDLVREISKLANICIRGLMTIAPFVENAEENRVYFSKLKELAVDIDNENIDNVDMSILSMGMTGDYPVAVSEGATYVRVGTGIFGARDYMTEREGN
jgi:hypothetical protein